ncbi:hypothetical protein SLE2022_070550 [Rubroshorea leprosula]
MDQLGSCGPANEFSLQPAPFPNDLAPSSIVNQDGDSQDDYDFSDVVLKYISQMLMEEDMEEKTCMFQESSAALQAAEKSLYELLGEKYPPPKYDLNPCVDLKQERLDENHDQSCWRCNGDTMNTRSFNLMDPGCNCYLGEHNPFNSQSLSQSPHSSGANAGSVVDGFVDSPVSTLRLPEIEIFRDGKLQFRKGFEEASKFMPNASSQFVDVERYGLFLEEPKEEAKDTSDTVAKNDRPADSSRGKKHRYPEVVNEENGRSNKQPAVFTESTVSPEMYHRVLDNQSQNEFRQALQNGTSKNVQQNGSSKRSSGGKARGKKQGRKRDMVDLRALLTLCAQAVAAADSRSANDFLKQIRQHSSPIGDGMQRMAHYFADGLEARLAGSGTETYTALLTRPTSAADVLKAYHLLVAACPYRKVSNFFCNSTIMNLVQAKNVARLHVVDFGILYGFQWPCLIRRLSSLPRGTPKLRITGIDLPQPGFRPAQRVEETGCRLANYAENFKVPFEFNAIAQKWDTIRIEDLKIESDEMLVVNCMFRLKNLLDETVVVDCPRNKVLNLIRKINPEVFIHGIVNGACNSPFFITRFREALFHYSTLFDMLETNVPRETPERMLIEREFYGREAINVIASEGLERIERPETYKQWQVRNLRAGFRQLPLNDEIMKTSKERVSRYHKDYVVVKDGQWLLQGWKGRIVYALSSWAPA